MRALLASVAVLGFLLSSAVTAAEDKKVGLLQHINLQKGVIKVGPAQYSLAGYSMDGLQIGDNVRIVFTQEDEHDMPVVKTITKLPAARVN